MMVPPYLKDDAIEKAPALDVPAVGGGAAFIAFVAQPWRALGARGPVEVPKSIRKVTFTLIPASDGGATLRIDALDESPDAARSHAALLTSAVNTLTQQNMGAVGALLFGSATVSFIEPVNLVAKGASIQGDAHVTSRQLDRLIGFAEGWVDSLEAPPRPASSGAPLSSGRPSPVPR